MHSCSFKVLISNYEEVSTAVFRKKTPKPHSVKKCHKITLNDS